MLDYAVKLTRAPSSVGDADVGRLREHGFSEAAVLDVCQVAAYYNYVNRLADGLGVELEPSWREEELTMTAAEFEERTGHPPVPPAGSDEAAGEASRGEHAPPPSGAAP